MVVPRVLITPRFMPVLVVHWYRVLATLPGPYVVRKLETSATVWFKPVALNERVLVCIHTVGLTEVASTIV